MSERVRTVGEEGRGESERANIPFPSDAAERFTHAWKSLK